MFGFGGAFSSAAEVAPPPPKAEEPAATDAPAGGEAVEAVEAAAVVDEAIEPEVEGETDAPDAADTEEVGAPATVETDLDEEDADEPMPEAVSKAMPAGESINTLATNHVPLEDAPAPIPDPLASSAAPDAIMARVERVEELLEQKHTAAWCTKWEPAHCSPPLRAPPPSDRQAWRELPMAA